MTNRDYLPKEKAIYQAVLALFEEGADLNALTVSEITKKAGIGKGTAYEYFSDKEEMIAKALFYNAEVFCKQLYEGMVTRSGFYDKIEFLLLTMEKQLADTNCIFRLMMLSDNSMLSKRMRELREEKKLSGEVPGIHFIRKILSDEFQGKIELSKDKKEYLVLNIYAKLLCFIIWLEKDDARAEKERETIRGMICHGICREVEELTVYK